MDCDVMGNCNYQCPGGGCVFDCDNTSNCDIKCPGGGCDITCDGNSTCAVDCSGTTDMCVVTCVSGGHLSSCINCMTSGC
jgi:hypothetical protein